MGLVALQHVGSSRTRAQTCFPCIGRRILNHCATREVLQFLYRQSSGKLCTFLFQFCLSFRRTVSSNQQHLSWVLKFCLESLKLSSCWDLPVTLLSYLCVVLVSKSHYSNNTLGTSFCILWTPLYKNQDYYQSFESLVETTRDGQLYGSIWWGASPQVFTQTLIQLLLGRYFADVLNVFNQLTLGRSS